MTDTERVCPNLPPKWVDDHPKEIYCPHCGFSEFAKLEIDGGLDCLNCGAWVHPIPEAYTDENMPVPSALDSDQEPTE